MPERARLKRVCKRVCTCIYHLAGAGGGGAGCGLNKKAQRNFTFLNEFDQRTENGMWYETEKQSK